MLVPLCFFSAGYGPAYSITTSKTVTQFFHVINRASIERQLNVAELSLGSILHCCHGVAYNIV